MRSMKALYTAVATATDQGRNGHVSTDDGKLDLQMSMTAEVNIGRSGPGWKSAGRGRGARRRGVG